MIAMPASVRRTRRPAPETTTSRMPAAHTGRTTRRRGVALACTLLALAALAGGACSKHPTQPGVDQPHVRHLLFTSGDHAVVGETLYVTSEVINDGPGTIWFWRGPGLREFDIVMGDTMRVYESDPTIVPMGPISIDSLIAGERQIGVLPFTGPLWDSLGRSFDAPDGRYVVRRSFGYLRSRTVNDPIVLARGVEFHWVVP